MSRQLYLKDRAWADKWSPEIRAAVERVGGKLLSQQPSSDSKDKRQATDWELRMENGDIAVRFRRQTDYRDLTIRSRRLAAGGQEIDTEHHKILGGQGPVAYLYFWTDLAGTVVETMFVDMRVLRTSGLMEHYKAFEKPNKDGSTFFYAIPQRDLRAVGALIDVNKRVEKTLDERFEDVRQKYAGPIAEYRRYLEQCGVVLDP